MKVEKLINGGEGQNKVRRGGVVKNNEKNKRLLPIYFERESMLMDIHFA